MAHVTQIDLEVVRRIRSAQPTTLVAVDLINEWKRAEKLVRLGFLERDRRRHWEGDLYRITDAGQQLLRIRRADLHTDLVLA